MNSKIKNVQFNIDKRLLVFIGLSMCAVSLKAQPRALPKNKNELQTYAEDLLKAKPDSASIYFEKLSKAFRQNKQSDLEMISRIYIAESMFEQEDYEVAKNILTKLLRESEKDLDAYSKIIAHRLLGRIEFQNGRFFASTQHTRTAMESARNTSDDELIASLQEDFAKIFDKINRVDKAIQFYYRSLKLYSKIGKQEPAQTCALALGRLYLSENKPDSALDFINQSIALSETLRNEIALAESRIEEANVYLKKKNYDKTAQLINSIDPALEKETAAFVKVRQYVLKGTHAMMTLGDSAAKVWFDKAETYSRPGYTVFIDNYIRSSLADAYYAKGKIEKAYEHLKYINHLNASYSSKENQSLAEDLIKNSELNIRDREIEFLKIQNQLKQEKLEKELLLRQSLQRENQLKDKTLMQETLLNEATLREQELQAGQLEKEKNLSHSLLRENELKQSTLNAQQSKQGILWTGIGILFCLGGFITYLFRKQKEKNAIILKQTKDLEFINKEVHHRVKNNLQVISSLLDLQSQSNTDHAVSNLLRESKHRVQSMAFIHQNLYEGEGMNMVDMQSYVQNLVDHLKTTYQRDTQQITIHTSVSPMRLHMDQVVSVGMIVNELVTNSLKYAFIGRKEGTIEVKITDFANHHLVGTQDLASLPNGDLQNNILLTVADDGIGIPDDIDISTIKSFGYKMIRAFAQKLKAKLTIENESGTKVQLQFQKK